MTPDLAVVIDDVAASLGVESRALRAVLSVESAGSGLGPDGRPTVRLELHLLRPRIPADVFARHYRIEGPGSWQGHQLWCDGIWLALHVDQPREWLAIERIPEHFEAACLSASWGAAQILGSHHRRLGYDSAVALALAFGAADEQIRAFGRFLATGKNLVWAIREHRWDDFTAEYNGRGQIAYYSGALRMRYEEQP